MKYSSIIDDIILCGIDDMKWYWILLFCVVLLTGKLTKEMTFERPMAVIPVDVQYSDIIIIVYFSKWPLCNWYYLLVPMAKLDYCPNDTSIGIWWLTIVVW